MTVKSYNNVLLLEPKTTKLVVPNAADLTLVVNLFTLQPKENS